MSDTILIALLEMSNWLHPNSIAQRDTQSYVPIAYEACGHRAQMQQSVLLQGSMAAAFVILMSRFLTVSCPHCPLRPFLFLPFVPAGPFKVQKYLHYPQSNMHADTHKECGVKLMCIFGAPNS